MTSAIDALKELIVVMTEVLTELKKLELFNRRNLIWTGIVKFNALLSHEEITKEDIEPYIHEVYSKVRLLILNSQEDSWMTNQKIIFWYGEDIPEVKKDNYKLLVAACYNKAVSLKNTHESKLTGNSDLDMNMLDDDMMFYPAELTYYTLKVFKCFIEDSKWKDDIPSIEEYMSEIANDIGLVDKEDKSPNSGTDAVGKFIESFTRATGAGQSGIPEGAPEQINSMVDKIFGNKDLQASMRDIFADLNSGKVTLDDPSNIGNVITGMFQKIGPQMENITAELKPPEGVSDNNTMPPPPDLFAAMGNMFKSMSFGNGQGNDIGKMMQEISGKFSSDTQNTATVTEVETPATADVETKSE